MSNSRNKALIQATALGVLAGMRTTAAPLALSFLPVKNPSKWSIARKILFGLMAAGELVGDKLPTTPARTAPLGVAGRGISGAITGALAYKNNGDGWFKGAIIGAGAAVGATYLAYNLRKAIVKKYGVFDPIAGGVEDVITIAGGVCLACL
jgi:uncharacterized membrane protein